MKPKILIADDEPDSVSFMKDALEDAGYDVLVAYDGTQVFEQLANRPNLIILNVMMPHADGFEVARAISRPGQLSDFVFERPRRRAGENAERHIVYDGIVALDARNYELFVHEKLVPLTPRAPSCTAR